jgi:hypothetical protein
MPYVGKSPDLNASVDTNELADDAVTLGKIGEDVKTAISGSFLAKADKSAISGSVASGFEFDGSISGSSTSTGSFGHVSVAGVLKTGDIELENKRGHWKIVEESEYLSIYNVKTDKKFKFVLEEIE